MKSETLIYGMELLIMLDEIGEIPFKGLEEKTKIKGDELRALLKYLKQKEYIIWKMPLFIGTLDKIDFIDEDKIKLSHSGMEIVLGKKDYFDEMGISQTIHNQTNVHGSSEFQVAQTSGDNSSIVQIQDNSKISVLRQMIEEDEELDKPKKKKLLEVLEKFNTIKESGENAFDLIKQVGSLAVKYVPMFFGLLH